MKLATRVPIEIVQVQGPEGLRVVPQVFLSELVSHPDLDLQKEMDAVAMDYWSVVQLGKRILATVASNRRQTGRTDVTLYWDLGDVLQRFIEKNESSQVYLNGIKAHFIRDLKISGASWRKILRFRYLIGSKQLIDASRPWKFYRDAASKQIRDVSAKGPSILRQPPRAEPSGVQQDFLDDRPDALKHDLRQPHRLDRLSAAALRKRSRIEVHLPSHALDQLREVAKQLGLRSDQIAAAARTLLLVLLDENGGQRALLLRMIQDSRATSVASAKRSKAKQRYKSP